MKARTGSGQALVIVPTYNECENIIRLVNQLRALPEQVHVLIVDDNSPDGTGNISDGLAVADPSVHVIHREGKLGLGTAYRAGFKFGLARGYRYLCTMDADFSHDPQSLPALLEKASSGYDLVVGSRYVPGGRIVGCTLPRQMISYSANWLAHLILGGATHDCTAGFRCYRRAVLETIDLDSISLLSTAPRALVKSAERKSIRHSIHCCVYGPALCPGIRWWISTTIA